MIVTGVPIAGSGSGVKGSVFGLLFSGIGAVFGGVVEKPFCWIEEHDNLSVTRAEKDRGFGLKVSVGNSLEPF